MENDVLCGLRFALTVRFFFLMSNSIGAGARIYMGTAGTPVLPFTTSATDGARAAYDVTDYLKNINRTTAQATVDITKLSADKDAYFRSFIAGLRNATASGAYGDDQTGYMERRVDAICASSNHPRGRGKVDMIVRPFGDGAGKVQYRYTFIFTNVGSNTAIEEEIGGDISQQIDGQVYIELQV
jgi:hypothetical protein